MGVFGNDGVSRTISTCGDTFSHAGQTEPIEKSKTRRHTYSADIRECVIIIHHLATNEERNRIVDTFVPNIHCTLRVIYDLYTRRPPCIIYFSIPSGRAYVLPRCCAVTSVRFLNKLLFNIASCTSHYAFNTQTTIHCRILIAHCVSRTLYY